MDTVIIEMIKIWGPYALIIVLLVGFIAYIYKDKKNPVKEQSESGKYQKDDLIYETLKDMNLSIKESLDKNIIDINNNINNKIDNLETKLNNKINNLESKVDIQISYLDTKVNEIPVNDIVNVINTNNKNSLDKEYKAMLDKIRLGADIEDILIGYTKKINCTHILLASFHNGAQSLTGLPYFKFNIISEVFNPDDPQENDHPFAPVYKDCELTMHSRLFLFLFQNKSFYFSVEQDKISEMDKYDNIIINRMRGLGIKQIAACVTTENEKISGFICAVKYDDEQMNLDMLKLCVKELELIHNNTPIPAEYLN